MTKTPKIEIHGSIVFTDDGPHITVNSHIFGSLPKIDSEAIRELCGQFEDEANTLVQHQVSNTEKGGYDGTDNA